MERSDLNPLVFIPAPGSRNALVPGLDSGISLGIFPCMSSKELVIDLVRRLPDEVSLRDIVREIEFVAGVREGLDSFEREGGFTVEEAKTKLDEWTAK